MSDHPIAGMMDVTMAKIKEMVDVNTIVGEPITTADGTTIIPVSKVSYGFASGGSDFAVKSSPNKDLFGGGSGAGVSIVPIAFIAVSNGNVKLLNIQETKLGAAEKAINMAPELIDKITGLFKKDNAVDSKETIISEEGTDDK